MTVLFGAVVLIKQSFAEVSNENKVLTDFITEYISKVESIPKSYADKDWTDTEGLIYKDIVNKINNKFVALGRYNCGLNKKYLKQFSEEREKVLRGRNRFLIENRVRKQKKTSKVKESKITKNIKQDNFQKNEGNKPKNTNIKKLIFYIIPSVLIALIVSWITGFLKWILRMCSKCIIKIFSNLKEREEPHGKLEEETETFNEEEKELLISASKKGEFNILEAGVEIWVRVPGVKDYQDNSDPAISATYKEAFDSLLNRGYIENVSGLLYRLTGSGFKIARELAKYQSFKK